MATAAAEETKATPTTTDDTSTATAIAKKEDDPTANAIGTTWNCKRCGLVNEIASWNCIACYSTMKYSMQDKRNKNKNKNKKKSTGTTTKGKSTKSTKTGGGGKGDGSASKSDDARSRRQAKREKLREQEDKNKVDDDDKEEKKMEYKHAANIPKTMRALIKEKDSKGFVLKNDYPVPTPKEGELLVRSFAVAICGSDNILYNWSKDAQTIAKLPFIPGHEAAGLVVGCGPETRFKIGDRVAIENHFFCGECYQCKEMNRKD
eukprot:94849_1